MSYSRKFRGKSGLEDLQDQRAVETNTEEKTEIQKEIDQHFFGAPGRRKTKKERKKDAKRERMKNEQEDY